MAQDALKTLENFRRHMAAELDRTTGVITPRGYALTKAPPRHERANQIRLILAQVDALMWQVKFNRGAGVPDNLKQHLRELRAALKPAPSRRRRHENVMEVI